MTHPIRLGVLTLSSNTALEPLTSALAALVPGFSAHFSHFKVTEIALSPQALGQFDDSKILAAAELLADARVDVIGWSGTAAGWLGFDSDLRAAPLARQVEAALDIPLLDSVSTTVWGMLRTAAADPAAIRGWGRLYDGS